MTQETPERGEQRIDFHSATEEVTGYVVDVGCIRKWPRERMGEWAREHTRACALMGHCLESGYGLVDEEGRIALLDSAATLKVVDAVRASERERGIRLRASRRAHGDKMETEIVEEI